MVKLAKRIVLPVAVLIVLGILPLFYGNDRYIMNILILCMIWGVVASSWDLIVGYANIFAFGQLAFFVVGGYTSGLLSKWLGISPWLGMLCGGLAAAFVGLLIGLPCLRLRGMYLAMVTFSVQSILPTFIIWAGPLRFEKWHTGGSYGLQAIPAFTLFGYTFVKAHLIPWYYLTMAWFVIALVAIYLVIRSPIGLAFVALRDSEPLAKTVGVDEYRYKLLVFAISSLIAGMTGAFYAHYFAAISPNNLSLETFLIGLVMVLLGGLGVFPGAAIGAFVVTILNELLRPTQDWRLVILGALVVLTMLFMPKGLMGIPEVIRKLYRRLKSPQPATLAHEEVQ
jgi:branched-chain amino acid transport system permease protein